MISESRTTSRDPLIEQAFRYYRRLRKVKAHVEQYLAEDLTLERISSVAGLSEKYFSMFFHEKVGMTFRDWLARVRVERAKALMKEANHSITQVAEAVGYRDIRTFERAFKRLTTLTPRAYKVRTKPSPHITS